MANAQLNELQETLDAVQDILEDAYRPEAGREELAEAIGRALDEIDPGDDDYAGEE